MNKFNLEQFIDDLDELHIFLEENQLNQFIRYYELLVEWNS